MRAQDQDIVISQDVFEKISNSLKPGGELLDYRSFHKNLENKSLVLDENHFLLSQYRYVSNNASDLGRAVLNTIIAKFLDNGDRVNYKHVNCKDNQLFELALQTESKILNSEDKKFESANPTANIEIVNFDEFLNPPSDSRLANVPRTIRLKLNDKFIIQEQLYYFFKIAKKLEITDRYIAKNENGFKMFSKILRNCPLLSQVIINTDFRKPLDNSTKFYLTSDNFYNVLSKSISAKTKIVINQISSRTHDRNIIINDHYDISLSSGLDFVDKFHEVYRETVRIDIEEIKNKS